MQASVHWPFAISEMPSVPWDRLVATISALWLLFDPSFYGDYDSRKFAAKDISKLVTLLCGLRLLLPIFQRRGEDGLVVDRDSPLSSSASTWKLCALWQTYAICRDTRASSIIYFDPALLLRKWTADTMPFQLFLGISYCAHWWSGIFLLQCIRLLAVFPWEV